MKKVEKTVFISYRRTNAPWALSVYQNLTHHGYDVFFDYQGIASGDFERIILDNIKARAHFLVLLTPSALQRCGDQNDWLRREIETALDTQRNIVPLMLEGFDFSTPAIASQLTGKLSTLSRYNALRVPADYFDEAMERLRDKYLNLPIEAVLHPASLTARQSAMSEQAEANRASPVRQQELSAQELMERGINRASLSDFENAMNDFEESIRLDPKLAGAYIGRGMILMLMNDPDRAKRDLDEGIRLGYDHGDAYIVRSKIHREKGDLSDSLLDSQRAVTRSPLSVEAYDTQGFSRAQSGDFRGALDDYEMCVRLEPDNPNYYFYRGVMHEKLGHYAAAADDLQRSLELGGKSRIGELDLKKAIRRLKNKV